MESSISRILVQTTVRKALKDIKEEPERSLRNLVDMAQQFASGRFQQRFFQTAQKMLTNEKSAYFSLMQDTVEHVGEERLVTFGMNIGYNSCTVGAAAIRAVEAREGYNVPWAISLQMEGDMAPAGLQRYSELMDRGVELGIYTWFLFVHGEVDVCMNLIDRHPNCAFILFCDGQALCGRVLDEAMERKNLMLALPFDEAAEESCARLREAQLLYSLYYVYSKEDVAAIESGDLFADMEQLHPVFSALIPRDGCEEAVRKQVYDALTRFRQEQTYHTMLWELYRDGLLIDKIISNDGCWGGFDADGRFYGIGEDGLKRYYGSIETPLVCLLRQAFPKRD